ncbi:ABC transporter permease [Psychrobacillus sp. BM2]|uniref:ABC transporter permease n=1 Tax=Psychrobacillus sp. BM2 TaxID=3400421 RepID=UPI003B013FE5
MKRTFKNKLFLFGFGTISALLFASVFYYFVFHDQIPISPLLYDNNGKPLPAPYNWNVYPPLGADNFGRNIAIVMLIGVKYTILVGIVITIFRVVPSTLFGFIIHFWLHKIERPIKYIADSINYFPTTLLVFLLFGWTKQAVSYGESPPSFWGLILFYIFIVTIVAIPSLSVLIANEIRLINKMEFIGCSRTLGASSRRIIIKHIAPFLVPQLFIISIREFLHTLLLMAHLGVLGIFIGGVTIREDLFGISRALTQSNEWAGVIGMWWSFLWSGYPWIAFIPIVFLTILILATKCILDGFQNTLSTDEQVVKKPEHVSIGELKNLDSFQLLKAKVNE